MTEQISDQERESGRWRRPVVTRRTAHSPKLKRSLDGIKDWTARLPSLRDHPRWRAPLPNVTELSPGWRRHDRTHLEINLEHPADDGGRTWEAWIFMPQSFRLNPDTYTTRRIGSDFQSHIRLSAPELRLGDVASEVDRVAMTLDQADPDVAIDELKLFACRVREAIGRETHRVRMSSSLEAMEADSEALVNDIEIAVASIRNIMIPAAERSGPGVAEVMDWVDEHVSVESESSMVRLVTDLSRRKSTAPVVVRVQQVAVAEARHRAERGDSPAMSADSTTFELEPLARHRHALKRLTSSVLGLRSEAGDARRGAENVLHSIAAGIAMAFAITAALLYGPPNDATALWVWGGLAVLAYIGKDRIKAGLQSRFNRYIDRRYPNRRWIVRREAGAPPMATADEKYGFVEPDKLPPDVAEFRQALQEDALGEVLELDSILYHRKATLVDAKLVHAIDPRFDAITEILRVDVAGWLTHTDDPKRNVTLADPDSGELVKSSLPRAYDVTILHRLAPTGTETPWSAARVVLSRKGIRRVDQLDA